MPRYPNATWRPLSRNFTARTTRKTRVILHSTGSATQTSQHEWFNTAGANASSHFHVASDGAVEQYVDTGHVSWASGEGNDDSISIETQGDGTGPWTSAQVSAIVGILRWAHDTHGVPLTQMESSRAGTTGVGWHRLGVNGAFPALPSILAGREQRGGGEKWSSAVKVCPGDDRIQQVPAIIAAAKGGQAQAPAAKPATGGGTVYRLTGADELSVRTGPGLDHPVVGTLPQEVDWTATGRVKSGWVEGATPFMLTKGKTGWVSGAELTATGGSPAPATRRSASATHNGVLIRYHVYNEDMAVKKGVVIFLHGDNPRSDTRDGTASHITAMAQAARAAGWVLVVPVSPKATWWLADGQSSGMRVVAPQLQALRTFIPAVRAEVGLAQGGTVLMGHSGGAEAIAEQLARTDVDWAGGSITAMLVGGGTPNTVYPIDAPQSFRDASRMTWAGSKDGDGLGATSQNGGTWSAWASAERGEAAYRKAGYDTRLVDTRAKSHLAYDFGGLMTDLLKEAA